MLGVGFEPTQVSLPGIIRRYNALLKSGSLDQLGHPSLTPASSERYESGMMRGTQGARGSRLMKQDLKPFHECESSWRGGKRLWVREVRASIDSSGCYVAALDGLCQANSHMMSRKIFDRLVRKHGQWGVKDLADVTSYGAVTIPPASPTVSPLLKTSKVGGTYPLEEPGWDLLINDSQNHQLEKKLV
ncbi:hypothetical protein CROQUDRAFT_99702 [Cronartium quercuum f. sp. fusiforme G11]|uniref:Uncharacterized protein n=1 Tax=Cronartium quercuum f. sp. fusiforme G11 TaxID=708437 RepID=A0A9P6NAL9_9BASI|nr:hypothetical protein CROQUDRAFT_99702 [Cronartium quercuum f. sp. fusiforme G11]